MGKYIIKRVLQAIPLLLVISFVVFLMIYIAPFDVLDTMITPNMTLEQIELLRLKYRLDDPFIVQYWTWLSNIFKSDLGYSLITQASISKELSTRIIATMKLVIPSYITALFLAVILGLISAANKGKLIDKIVDGIVSIGIATPTFWFAMLIIYLFGYNFKLFPIIGMHTIGKENDFLDFLSHFVMPYLTLTWAFFPRLTRYIRASAIEQISEDYVMVQKSFHASKTEIFVKHIGRNVMIPIVTQIGMALPMLVTGALITESIFSWPGVGPYLMTATRSLDYPVIMAVMLFSATLVILGNLLADILYSIVDPRIRQ
ncbi:MAG: ABC transporter permease [Erysipelotrichaceae bacterium]|nr:ABC transporter permease [Erysipelotrichaceae bacterium]